MKDYFLFINDLVAFIAHNVFKHHIIEIIVLRKYKTQTNKETTAAYN